MKDDCEIILVVDAYSFDLLWYEFVDSYINSLD